MRMVIAVSTRKATTKRYGEVTVAVGGSRWVSWEEGGSVVDIGIPAYGFQTGGRGYTLVKELRAPGRYARAEVPELEAFLVEEERRQADKRRQGAGW